MYKCVSGTLVAVVPSSEGLVVAADSRALIHGGAVHQFDDTVYKIVVVARPFRTVIVVPGTGVMHQVPDGLAGDLANELATAPKLLDIPSVVKGCLESGPEELNEEIVRNEIPRACQAAVRQATAQEPDHIRQFADKVLCDVVVANYSCERRCSTIGSFAIFMEKETVEPRIQNVDFSEFRDEHQRDLRYYGETAYVQRHLDREEKSFHPFAVFSMSCMWKTVGETSAQEAQAAAVSLIEAASEMAKRDPPEFGIGGPIDVVLLGAPPAPVRVQWKAK